MTKEIYRKEKKIGEESSGLDFIAERLRKDIVVPDIVQKKTLQTLTAIKTECREENEQQRKELFSLEEGRENRTEKKRRRPGKRLGVILAAAILAVGGVTAAAGVYIRSQKKEEKTEAPELLHMTSQSNGIRITVAQSLADNYFALLRFKVQGYEIKDGMQPFFEECQVIIDGRDISYGMAPAGRDYKVVWGFYSGIATGADNKPVRAWDNTPVSLLMDEYSSEGDWYVREDGSLEFEIRILTPEKKGKLFQKPVHIELKNLGGIAKAEFAEDADGAGTWEFDGALAGSENVREMSLDAEIGDTGIKVIKAELSPISITAYYDKPAFSLKSTPELRGVRMKDGTLYPCLNAGPGMDVTPPDRTGDAYDCFAIERVLDAEQIDALLFEKQAPNEGEAYTEENLYIVPLE